MFGQDREGGAGATLRGALLLLTIGASLGAAYNTLARAGKPSRGLPWYAGPAPVVTLESLQPAGASPDSAGGVPHVPDHPGPIELEIGSLKKLYDADAALIVDGREAAEYAAGHIQGAINLPYDDALHDPDKVQRLDSGGRPIVLYCGGAQCEVSLELADLMIELEKRRVLVFKAGYSAWESAGYPIERGAPPGARP
jgi:rhodanese-related sulfurtransferase